ncbi:MAG: CDP-diacylglycerol--glycerol-3-phosphate 3-phosphatidyltransferase, partial [Solirubrobacterales bacterium]|nr:CDP-diacylglycerol--glycerol-3-phosphate 3-phosphatidyltransferase [Solirubrobacterales bacterium]
IPASRFGKLKTCFQIAMVLVLIIERGRVVHAWWVHVVVYATVLVTVLSGLEYFYGALKGGLDSLGNRPTD